MFGVTATPFIIPTIFPEYTEAVIAIQIISLAVIPSTITLILSSKFLGDEKSKVILIARIIFAVVIISLIVILTPIYGISGTTGSFVIASIIQAAILFVYYRLRN